MKKIAILGASGSIGTSTLNVIRNHKDKFELVAFSVYNNISKIALILDEFKTVKLVSVKSLDEIKDLTCKYSDVKFVEKEEGLLQVSSIECDIVVNGLVGFVGLLPTLKAIESKNDVALANKETLVAAGSLVMKKAKENNVKIIPVDSEHSAIYQCLEDNKINSIILTASGGPFYKKSKEELMGVSVEEALNHPTWKMGAKISIDSATMFNKAFEIIEAYHLFNVKKEQIKVLIHPQSIVHSLVEFVDGSMKAHLGVSDMKIPIAYALSYPKRLDNIANYLKLEEVCKLEFYKADENRFKALSLAFEVLKKQGTYPCVMNASNEEAVNLFLNGKIKFYEIEEVVSKTLKEHQSKKEVTLKDIIDADKWAREYVRRTYL